VWPSARTVRTRRTARADGTGMLDDDFLLLINAWWEPLRFTLPVTRAGQVWRRELDTLEPGSVDSVSRLTAADPVPLGPRALVVLRAPVAR
jgi:isoamylase